MSRTVCDKPPLCFISRTFQKATGRRVKHRKQAQDRSLGAQRISLSYGHMGRRTRFLRLRPLQQQHFPCFPNQSTVWSWLPPTAPLRSSIANLLPRSWHTGPRSSNTPETGRKHSQRFIFNPDSELLRSKFQRTRGSWGQDTRAITAACGLTASAPRTGRQRGQHR